MTNNRSERAKKAFSLFSPYIQNHIYSQGWDELHQIQIQAAEEVFFTKNDILIASGTASGKTEAALFPILSLLEKEKTDDFQILYISPIKALINDQFERTKHLLMESNASVYHYHGDISQSHKEAFFKAKRGILQITPESLESLLLRRWHQVSEFFSNLRFVIIDEIHALMGSDRGDQILCQLKRIETEISNRPRRIGLSATISSPEKAANWLSADENGVSILKLPKENESLKVGLEHFFEEMSDGPTDADRWIYRATKGIKSIVFSNSREETETIAKNLKRLALEKEEEDRFYIHHANLSSATRTEAETKLSEDEKQITVLATSTLEYGIDIEKLKRVVCQESPLSVSSFLQRLGRSGRREKSPEMLLCFRENPLLLNTPLYKQIPWELLQAIAIIELYRKERFIEEAEMNLFPASLIFHQTLTVLGAEGGKTASELAKRILSLPPFRHFEKEDYRNLLIHMIQNDYLELCESKELIPGLRGEQLLNSYQFLSVFQGRDEFSVFWRNERIGSIGTTVPKGECFTLAGKVWEVEDFNVLKKCIYVRPGKQSGQSAFKGQSSPIHTKILEKMREILLSEETYPYLFPAAANRLKAARKLAEDFSLSQNLLFYIGGGEYVLFPFKGSKEFETIKRILEKELSPSLLLSDFEVRAPYYICFRSQIPKDRLKEEMRTILQKINIENLNLISPGEHPVSNKFDSFLPKDLLIKTFEKNQLKKKDALSLLNKI